MPETTGKAAWGVYGGSARGSSHLRNGLPNQDSFEKWAGPDGSVAVLAVSDGHGSAVHFRSEIGSRMGVEAAVHALRETPLPVPDAHPRAVAQSIVLAWREAVRAHLEANPFTDQEWAKLPPKEVAQAKAAISANPTVAYGATLMAVLAAADEILYLQLGDGDILCVDQNGGTTRPMPEDSRLIANQTTSLCQPNAAEDFRSAHFRLSQGQPPALILVSSDGYANSFQSDQDFLRVGPDYLELLRQYGPEKVEAQLDKILPEASRKGSGDDITLGFIQRLDADKAAPAPLPPKSATVSNSAPPASATSVKAEARAAAAVEAPAPPVAEPARAPTPAAPPRVPQAVPMAAANPRPPAAAPRRPSPTTQENVRLRRSVFWLKLALGAVCVLGLAAGGLAWWDPPWLSNIVRQMMPEPPAPPAPPRPPHAPRNHPDERRHSQPPRGSLENPFAGTGAAYATSAAQGFRGLLWADRGHGYRQALAPSHVHRPGASRPVVAMYPSFTAKIPG